MKLNYSKFPRQSYTVLHNGEMMGLGVHPALEIAPGAWNILWLTAADTVENLLSWDGPPESFPMQLKPFPLAVATALQYCNPTQNFGQLALELPPTLLLDAMQICPVQPYLAQIYGEAWYELARETAKLYVPSHPNVITVDFRCARPH